MSDLLRVRDLKKSYGDFALRGVNLTVPEGAVVGLVGSNGAGKTTLIKAVLGLVRPDGGSADLLGCDVLGASSKEAAHIRQDVGVVFDTCSFPSSFRVDDVRSVMSSVYRGWDDAVFDRYLEEFSLSRKKKVGQLSRGMGMKLSLACALAHGARLLILDEATAGLDPMAREEVLATLRAYMEPGDRGILMSTHITTDLERIADYVVCIDGGREVFSCEKDQITEGSAIARCRTTELEQVAASGFFAPGELRFVRSPYGVDVLVPDRGAFARRFPEVALDRASVESYMALAIKGETR